MAKGFNFNDILQGVLYGIMLHVGINVLLPKLKSMAGDIGSNLQLPDLTAGATPDTETETTGGGAEEEEGGGGGNGNGDGEALYAGGGDVFDDCYDVCEIAQNEMACVECNLGPTGSRCYAECNIAKNDIACEDCLSSGDEPDWLYDGGY